MKTPKDAEIIKAAPIPNPPTEETPFACSILIREQARINKDTHNTLETKALVKIIR